jgi:hypothetical protein
MRMVVSIKLLINIWSQAWSQNQSIASYNIVYMAITITMLHTLLVLHLSLLLLYILVSVSVRQQYLPELVFRQLYMIINLIKTYDYELSIRTT